jgi:zinc ribbon protein
MSASPATADSCHGCGAELPRSARFCPECGTPAGGGTTLKAELPRQEPAPGPVSISQVEPHWFGVPPATFLLGVAAVVLVVAVILLVSGSWPFGLILLGLAALLFACFLDLARRRPHSPVTRMTSNARERAGSILETWRARAAVTADVRRLHSGLAVLEAERRTALLELGAAAHQGDGIAEAGTRARLAELDEREAQLRDELDRRLAHAGERIRLARLAVEETMMVTPNEPYPPPGEATPPQPAIVPEPYPPPDEGTPPAPAPAPDEDQ